VPFSADSDVSWVDWEKTFSNLAILVGASELTRKIALLSTYLRGAAQTFFNEVGNVNPQYTTWIEWKQAFTQGFPDDQNIDIERDQLLARTQKVGETVLQYAADIRYLARRAQSNWTGLEENDYVKRAILFRNFYLI